MLTFLRNAFVAIHRRITLKIVIAVLACVWGIVALDAYLRRQAAAGSGLRLLGYYEVGGMLVILATVLVVIWVVVQRPLSQLMVAITRIRSGDLSVHCEVLVDDELGRLAASINAMLASLREKNRELQLLHETQIVQADRLASVGQLASGLAHEIKAPLHGVLSALEVLQAHGGDPQTGAVLAQIQAQISRVVAIASDMLSYACPHRPHFRLCDLGDILERTLALLRADAGKHNVRLEMNIDAALPKTLVDGEQMQQVCLNLLLNAIEAAGDGGEVSVSIAWQKESKLIAIRVTDSGRGVSDDVAARLFEPFFTTKKGGHGLGLATSRMLVTQNHGTIRLLSTPGTGACFEVLLPVIQEEASVPAAAGVVPSAGCGSSAVDAYLFGLACHCPLGIGESCPSAVLRDIRLLNLGERYAAIGKLSETEKAKVQEIHVACSFQHRDGAPSRPASPDVSLPVRRAQHAAPPVASEGPP
jgi:signal transduction histidine kinase